MEAHNILADNMQVCGPELVKLHARAVRVVAYTRNIV